MSTEKVYGLGGIVYDDFTFEGANLYLNATLGAERVIDGIFSVAGLAGWTLGAGWSDGTGKAAKAADGVGTLTQAVAIAAVVGTTYKIVYQVKDVTVDGVTLTYGGVADTTRLTNNTYTFYVTAITTGSLILTPSSNGSRFSIDNVSVKALIDATGDLTVDGNLTVKSPIKDAAGNDVIILLNSKFMLPDGSANSPSFCFASNTVKGIYSAATGQIVFTSGVAGTPTIGIKASNSSNIFGLGVEGSGTNFGLGIYSGTNLYATFEDYGLVLGANYATGNGITNGLLVEGSVGIGKQIPTRKLTVMTGLDIYELFTDASNYERYALIASGNQLEIKAETLGTGADNLDIALTPAGTGGVIVNGALASKINIVSYAGSQGLLASECLGYLILVTATGTITLPAVVVGFFVTIYSTAAAVVNIDPNDADRVILNGATTGNGKKITNGSIAGDYVTLVGDSADGWTVIGRSGVWTQEV